MLCLLLNHPYVCWDSYRDFIGFQSLNPHFGRNSPLLKEHFRSTDFANLTQMFAKGKFAPNFNNITVRQFLRIHFLFCWCIIDGKTLDLSQITMKLKCILLFCYCNFSKFIMPVLLYFMLIYRFIYLTFLSTCR